jgi:hypothetical protein
VAVGRGEVELVSAPAAVAGGTTGVVDSDDAVGETDRPRVADAGAEEAVDKRGAAVVRSPALSTNQSV